MPALLQVSALCKEFPSADGSVAILRDVTLRIHAGEMVAIMGPSGSGKSTLMNILGCLDRPTRGSYEVAGQDIGQLDPDSLARLRRAHFGFIFQRYQLLGELDAIGNVEIPAIYNGTAADARRARAQALLERLGLGTRLHHRPGQLSGGQQQRVSIARALMNGGEVILADEPTGALDQASGKEVMAILQELHAAGHTIILVTHDPEVAHAQRVIEIRDGRIVADRQLRPASPGAAIKDALVADRAGRLADLLGRFGEAAQMALRSIFNHRLRTLLTMLGIIIGISSVVSVVALGEGSRRSILSDIDALGTNTIEVMPGTSLGDRDADAVRTLSADDAAAIAGLEYVDSATPSISTSAGLRYGRHDVAASITGVGDQFFRVRGYTFAQGRGFDAHAIRARAPEAVIDQATARALFPGSVSALGKVILVGSVPLRIVGVAARPTAAFAGDSSLNVWLPYTTAMARVSGDTRVRSLTVRVSAQVPSEVAERGIDALLLQRHGRRDFFLSNSDRVRKTVEQTTRTITLLISSIALISLLVGGIGVMNIMLVSVTERIQEIGVRMAVGARQSDILRQFLIEATLVCLVGGTLGVALALGTGVLVGWLSPSFGMVFSQWSIIGAFSVSTAIGVVFGFLPARRAARLDPIKALARN
ncbi:MacB family efflux pump subunit [Xanthomonas floridensis]|uniref:Pyoverdine export ATP-binding/permease protein PvdT n=1 Tax=Xanthomonas floridensis TaxID=1843580 RepID=A0A1A9M8M9_9XANT|nr:MacB family efflux pump subunit [Xanthomonas floridensis]MEA5125723.1 MacB family efflux pump subunit [Xanthomonas floridensis]MEA5133598.1 MacB family efflux pump subunit [Xanthomonas floridensis]OAG66665.1 macrolide ABC transporter permease/ATP-binding protein MacB [Xanthomonas floridensis]